MNDDMKKTSILDGSSNVIVIEPHTKWWKEEFAPLLNFLGKNDSEHKYLDVDMFRVLQRGEWYQNTSRTFDLEYIRQGQDEEEEDYNLMMKGELLFKDNGSPSFETMLAALIDRGLLEWPENKCVVFKIWW